MKGRTGLWLLSLWATAAIGVGSTLTSYHQPFQAPTAGIVQLARLDGTPGWREVHVLSPGCGCSQRVMRHLLERGPLQGAVERILIVESSQPYLAGTAELLTRLSQAGFAIDHVSAEQVAAQARVHGVPLLVLLSPAGAIAYLGGYGSHSDQDGEILNKVRAGVAVQPLPILGCAVGRAIQRQADPFHLKY